MVQIIPSSGTTIIPPTPTTAGGHGFRLWLQRAIRMDEDSQHNDTNNHPAADNDNDNDDDWSPHTVDYALFKTRLKFFAHRRTQIRHLLRETTDNRIAETVLNSLVGEPPPSRNKYRIDFPPDRYCDPRSSNNNNDYVLQYHQQHQDRMISPTTDFQPMDLLHPPPSASYSDTDDSLQQQQHANCAANAVVAAAALTTATKTKVRRISKRTLLRRVSSAERQEMVRLLAWEIEKSCMFYLSQWQKLSRELETATNSSTTTTATHDVWGNRMRRMGDEILELNAFCVINVVTVQQILIRYDAFARTFGGTPLMNYYMKHATKHPTSFRKLLFHEELSAIADSYLLLLTPTMTMTSTYHEQQEQQQQVESFTMQRLLFGEILASSESAASIASTGNERLTDTFIHTVRNWYLLGAFVEDRLGFEPSYLTMRGQSLTNEIQQLAEWRQHKKKQHELQQQKEPQHEQQQVSTCALEDDEYGTRLLRRDDSPSLQLQQAINNNKKKPAQELNGMQVYHLTLNLMSGFLYCMNYYIVEPSSTMYVNRLGAYDALSGMLIGMMPLAAFVSSIPYSMWTNRSFRHPFVMSCVLLIIGNITYSLADRFNHVYYALAGRFICGLGAPKCIIRRYMADTTPMSLRTSVNAGFGMVVAAGSAMGPAMAVLLNKIDYTWHAPFLGFLYFDGTTLPGWFMASLWITFFVIVLVTFEEPDRQGLQEQKEKENLLEGGGTISTTTNNNNNNLPFSSSPSTLGSTLSYGDQDELRTIFSGEDYESVGLSVMRGQQRYSRLTACCQNLRNYFDLITFPVRICLGLLFAKVFTIEALVSATSALTKNRYRWKVEQVGTLGFINGLLVIPFSILVGRLSMSYQDHVLMRGLVATGSIGLFLLIDISDLLIGFSGTAKNNRYYNKGHTLAVGPKRYIAGYFLSYLSIQAFEGVIGSTLSKVIPTALASGTLNSGLLATLVDTFGRACGDLFISAMGYLNLRQLMNLLFIPTFTIMLVCLIAIERYRDLLSV